MEEPKMKEALTDPKEEAFDAESMRFRNILNGEFSGGMTKSRKIELRKRELLVSATELCVIDRERGSVFLEFAQQYDVIGSDTRDALNESDNTPQHALAA